MLRNFRRIRGLWVLSAETDPELPVGKVVDMVIDPLIGKVCALWVKNIDGKLKLLDFSDILVWRKTQISISSVNDLVKPEEFPALKKVLAREVQIIGADVYENPKNPRKIGAVLDFVINTNFPLILAFLVKKGWWIFAKKREIPREKVLEINSDGVFVDDLTLKIKADEKIPKKIATRVD